MKIDCFICNPPFGDKENTRLCTNIINCLKNFRVSCISTYGGVCGVIDKLTFIESAGWRNEVFPEADTWTYIWTMNDKKEVLYPIIHKLKIIKNGKYFFYEKGYDQRVYYITNKNNSENNRIYIDIENDEEMEEVNNYIKENFEKYKGFLPALNTHTWIIANILYNNKKYRERFVK